MTVNDDNLGRVLLDRGLLAREEFEDAMRARVASGRPLAALLVEKSYLSRVQVEDAIAAQEGRVRQCGRCNAPAYVALTGPEGERCPRCLDELRWKTEAPDTHLEEMESIAQLAQDELPPEVMTARAQQGRILGKYVLIEELGKGGTGIVQKAWDTMIGEYVALKFVREPRGAATSEQARKQRQSQIMDLLQEARAAMRLRHDHIVAMRDVGRIEDQFYISMEYIEGDTLADHIRAAQTRGRLSSLYEDPAFYLGALLDVAGAIHYAHTFPRPIVHCDLKPSNVLISVAGAAYVMDFGLARALDVHREAEAFVRGTPAYMAPEQLTGRSEDIGVWTDIYGLGAILYELMTGRPVFTGDTPSILASTMREPPQRPMDVIRTTKEASRRDSTQILAKATKLEGICLRCLAKDRASRFPSVRQFMEELEVVLSALESRPGTDTDVVPQRLREAQERAELRRVDDQLVQLNVERARTEVQKVERKLQDTGSRKAVSERWSHIELLERFRGRLVDRLNERRPRLSTLRIVGGAIRGAEVLKATPKKVVVFHGQKPMELPWASLDPASVVALAEATDMNSPEDKLALGLFCRHARLADVSVRFLTSLIGTPLEAAARQIIESNAE